MLPHLRLVAAEKERPIHRQRRAECDAELILMEHVGIRRVQHRACVQLVVHAEVIGRSAGAVRARFGHDVHEAAEGASVLGEIRRVEHAEFLGRFLRRRRARQTGERLHVVGAVDLNHRIQLRLPAERQSRRRRRSDADVRLLERAAADILAAAGDAARQLHEIDEVAAADRQRFDFLGADHAAQLGFGRLDERSLGDNGHLLGDRSQAHLDVGFGRAADGQNHVRTDDGLEVRELDAHFVVTRIERGNTIASVLVARGAARRTGRTVLDGDDGAGKGGPGGVAHGAEQCRRRNLSE